MPWPLAVRLIVRRLPQAFSLSEVYAIAEPLRKAFPGNRHVEAKIRQSLQILRDRGYLEFQGHGQYKKTEDVGWRTVRVDFDDAAQFASRSQIARVAIETWAAQNVACWRCQSPLLLVPPNTQLMDAICSIGSHEVQIKATAGIAGSHITGAAFGPIERRLEERSLPDYLIVSYDRPRSIVVLAEFIDGGDLVVARLKARSPLSAGARRAGWIGTSIDLSNLKRTVVVGPALTPEVLSWS